MDSHVALASMLVITPLFDVSILGCSMSMPATQGKLSDWYVKRLLRVHMAGKPHGVSIYASITRKKSRHNLMARGKAISGRLTF